MEIEWVDAEETGEDNAEEKLGGADGVLIPGGFGNRGIEGKIAAVKYAREHNVPFLGICLGMQAAVIEFARNILGLSLIHIEMCIRDRCISRRVRALHLAATCAAAARRENATGALPHRNRSW